MNKPSTCIGCPLYGDGKGYVEDELIEGAEVMAVLQNPGGDEVEAEKPAVGAAGNALNSNFIPLAQLTRGKDISVGNVIKCRWTSPTTGMPTNDLPSKTGAKKDGKGIDKAYGKEIERQAVEHCMSNHFRVPEGTKLLVAAGDVAWRGLKQPGTLDEWRGFLGPVAYDNVPVFGTYHPVFMMHQPRMTIPVMMDWKKIRSILHGHYPVPVPDRNIVSKPIDAVPDGTAYVVIDTEYNPGYDLTLLGIGYYPERGKETVPPLYGEQIPVSIMDYEETKERLHHLITTYPVVGHNILADVMALEVKFGFSPFIYKQKHCTMQAHALLQSEWKHDLGFVESMHSPHPRMKHLAGDNHLLYNWGDVLTCGYAFQDLMRELDRDTGSKNVYDNQNIPLIDIRFKAKRMGLCLDREFLAETSRTLTERITVAAESAQAYCGFPINVGSDQQFATWLQSVEGMKLKKKKGKIHESTDKDVVSELRRKFYDFDPDEEKDGITPEILDRNIESGGHPLLEARAMYQSATSLYDSYIKPFVRGNVPIGKGVRGFDPDEFVEWISPDQSTHSQSTGRWSITNPPLSTVPPKLRKMLRPPPGYVMIKYDADQQELRLNAHYAHDEPTLEAFRNKWDVHTLNFCDVFTVVHPPDRRNPHGSTECEIWRVEIHWEGKDDKRRVFCKRFVFRLIYRGDPRLAGDIPGAKAMGLTGPKLVEASKNYLSQHPALPKYWARMDAQIRTTRIARSPEGRKRFLNGSLETKPGTVPAIFREGTNHRIQGGGVDWYNLLLLTIDYECRDLPAIYVYGTHDSHCWFTPEAHESEFLERVEEITQRPWDIDGRPLILPVTLDKPIYPL